MHMRYSQFIIFMAVVVYFGTPLDAFGFVPNDPLYAHSKDPYEQIKAPGAWDRVTGSRDVIVAVLDSGVDIDHPDLKDNIWVNQKERLNGIDDDNNGFIDDLHGWDFVSDDSGVGPDTSSIYSDGGIHHGTVVAGLIGAVGNNGIDSTGVAMRVQIMPLKVMSNDGSGDVNDVIPAIEYAKNMGADIINLSFSGNEQSATLQNAMRAAYDAGLVVVVAAGNDNDLAGSGDLDQFPKFPVCSDKGSVDSVVGVGAVDRNDQLAEFSNFGSCIDLVAPGTQILSTMYHEDGRSRFDKTFGGYFQGTSLAAPIVAGSAALLKAKNPSWTNQDIVATLYVTADGVDFRNPDYIGKLGHGRINIDKASRAKIETVEVLLEPKKSAIGGVLVVGQQSGGVGEMRLIGADGEFIRSFQPVGSTIAGVSFVADDLNNDGVAEIIVVNGKTLQIMNQHGTLERIIVQRNPAGTPSIATADITGDGMKEIIVTYTQGTNKVYLYTHQGFDLGEFVGSPEAVDGLRVDAADVTGDGVAEIITSASHITENADVWVMLQDGNLYTAFQAFLPSDSYNESQGSDISTADVDGDGIAEIVAVPAVGSGVARLYTYFGSFMNEMRPFGDAYQGVINIASGDLEGDGVDEILVSAGPGGGPHVKMIDKLGNLKKEWFVFDPSFKGGVRVNFIKK